MTAKPHIPVEERLKDAMGYLSPLPDRAIQIVEAAMNEAIREVTHLKRAIRILSQCLPDGKPQKLMSTITSITLSEACKAFAGENGPRVDDNVNAVGEGDGEIVVYLKKRPNVQRIWLQNMSFQGWPIRAEVIGKIVPAGKD